MTLYKKLVEMKNKKGVSFHMPGHKHGEYLQQYFQDDWLRMDITEIPGADNLMDPQSVILSSQERARKLYGAEHTKFLVNGSTGGIEAMILAATQPGDKVLVNRNAHQSVFNALILADVEVIYLPLSVEDGILTTLDEEVFLNAIEQCNSLVLTYPTYEGVAIDIKKYIDIAHSKGVTVLVDAAHGAHFAMSDRFPQCPVEAGADIVVMSVHKTLPSMTQTALIHYRLERIDQEKLEHFLHTFQSSSPSYILMASIDLAIEYCEEHKHAFDTWITFINAWKVKLSAIEGIECISIPNVAMDETKIILRAIDLGYTGFELADMLNNHFNIQVEYSNSNDCLLMTSVMSSSQDFEVLLGALQSLPQKEKIVIDKNATIPMRSDIGMGLRASFYAKTEYVPLDKSCGRIVASTVISYPPGVPVIVSGEIMNQEQLSYIDSNMCHEGKILGLSNDKQIKVIV